MKRSRRRRRQQGDRQGDRRDQSRHGRRPHRVGRARSCRRSRRRISPRRRSSAASGGCARRQQVRHRHRRQQDRAGNSGGRQDGADRLRRSASIYAWPTSGRGELEFPPPVPAQAGIQGWRYRAETGGSASARGGVSGAQSLQAEMIALWLSLVEHDVFGKPASHLSESCSDGRLGGVILEARQSDAIVRLAQSRRRRQPRRRGRRGARHHRPERRRQIDAVQPDHRALRPDGGAVRFDGRDITQAPPRARCIAGIGRSFQIPHPFENLTVFENLLVAAIHGRRQREARGHRRLRRDPGAHRPLAYANRRAGTLTCSTASGSSSPARSPARRGSCCSTRSPAG